MLNTTENKLKFFAQYFGQRVLKNKNLNEPFNKNVVYDMLFDSYVNKHIDFFYLELRSIDSITDDECVEYFNLLYDNSRRNQEKIIAIKSDIKRGKMFRQLLHFEKSIIALDFLRSKGFLVPFMNLKTDQILEFGWAKIK